MKLGHYLIYTNLGHHVHYDVITHMLIGVKILLLDVSTTRFCFFLDNSLICLWSKKQSPTSKSGAESNYRALADTTHELIVYDGYLKIWV